MQHESLCCCLQIEACENIFCCLTPGLLAALHVLLPVLASFTTFWVSFGSVGIFFFSPSERTSKAPKNIFSRSKASKNRFSLSLRVHFKSFCLRTFLQNLPRSSLSLLLCCCSALGRHPAPITRRCCADQRVRLRVLTHRRPYQQA